MSQNEIRFKLGFDTDTKSAKKQIDELVQSLQKIYSMQSKGNNAFSSTSIKEAGQAALELEKHITKATNVNTGKLDLSKFSASIKSSKKSLNDYYNSLIKVGSTGKEAFLKVASAISQAESPIIRLSSRMQDFLTTLGKTAKWQLSNNVIRGFTSGLRNAYDYAQDLNESLNNIRIVTGQSQNEMVKFAKEANKAAKALSTTTTAYTDAALIYYQQGLSGTDVKKRTDVTMQLANVTGQSAAEVSSYMTAIWNNFDDGSKSLSHFADVITALGASTASSSREIAEGLEKFAAIGNTVGLSYEYATSALATVVAQTRQSADTVGTAFKTLFARIQDLEVGKTLDDGTSLGKYAQALQSIGINIKDVNGQVKDMDKILDEMGSKWNTISKDTQIAVAQTVAGTRQYSQLLALMDNWSEFQKNISTAESSTGALAEQAKIYEESWAASRKRVKASLQGVYDDLINDSFFIKMNDALAKVIEGVQKLIKSFGGVKGIITLVSSLMLKKFAKEIPNALTKMRDSALSFIPAINKKRMLEQQKSSSSAVEKVMNTTQDPVLKARLEGMLKETKMRQWLTMNQNKMTQSQREEFENQIEMNKMLHEAVAARQEELDLEKKKLKEFEKQNREEKKEREARLKGRIPGEGLSTEKEKLKIQTNKEKVQINKDKVQALQEKKISEINDIDLRIQENEKKVRSLTGQKGRKDPDQEIKKINEEFDISKYDKKSLTKAQRQKFYEEGLTSELLDQMIGNIGSEITAARQAGNKERETELKSQLEGRGGKNNIKGLIGIKTRLEIQEGRKNHTIEQINEEIEKIKEENEELEKRKALLESGEDENSKEIERLKDENTNLEKSNVDIEKSKNEKIKSFRELVGLDGLSDSDIEDYINNQGENIDSGTKSLIDKAVDKARKETEAKYIESNVKSGRLSNLEKRFGNVTDTLSSGTIEEGSDEFKGIKKNLKDYMKIINDVTENNEDAKKEFENLNKALENEKVTVKELLPILKKLTEEGGFNDASEALVLESGELETALENFGYTERDISNLQDEGDRRRKVETAQDNKNLQEQDSNNFDPEKENARLESQQRISAAVMETASSYVVAAQTAGAFADSISNLTDGADAMEVLSTIMTGFVMLQQIANAAQTANNMIIAIRNKLKSKEIIVEAISNAEKKEEIVLNGLLNATYWIMVAALAAIAIAVVAVTLHYKNLSKQKKKVAEQEAEELELEEKNLEEKKKQSSAIDELISKYDELAEKYKQNKASLSELRTSTYQLLTAYGYIDEGVKALSASYDDLGNIIDNVKLKQDEDTLNQAKKTADQARTSAIAEFESAASDQNSLENDAIDVRRKWGAMGDGLQKALKDRGIELSSNGKKIDKNSISEYLRNASSEDITAFMKELQSLNDKDADRLQELLKAALPNIQKADEVQADIKEYSTKVAGQTFINEKGIKSYEDYEKAVKSITEATKDLYDSEEDARNAARGYLATVDEVADHLNAWSSREVLTSELISKGIIPEEELKKLKLTNEQLEYLAANMNRLKEFLESGGTLEDFLNLDLTKNAVNIISRNNKSDTLRSISSSALESEKLTSSDYDTLFDETNNFELAKKYTKEEFKRLDYMSQMNIISQELINLQNENYKITSDNLTATKETVEALEEEKQAFEENNKEEQVGRLKTIGKISESTKSDEVKKTLLNRGMDNSIADEILSSFSSEQAIQNLLTKIATAAEEEGLDAGEYDSNIQFVRALGEKIGTDSDIYQQAITLSFLLDDSGVSMGDALSAQKGIEEYNATLKEFDENISNIKGTEQFVQAFVNASTQIEKCGKNLDEIQAQYKSLTSIVDNYNSIGFFTIDDMQTILDLSPSYLACLEKTADGYELNKEKMLEMTKANLVYLAQQEAEQTLAAIREATVENSIVDNLKELASVTALSGGTWGLVEAQLANAEAALADAKASGVSEEVYRAQADAVENLRKKIEIMKNTYDNTTLDNLDTQMTGSKHKNEDLIEDERDLYHDINRAIKDVTDSLSKLDKLKSHLHGAELIKALEKENNLLEKQAENYAKLGEIAKQDAATQRTEMNTRFGFGFSGSTGEITNYDQVYSQELSRVNNAIAIYNASSQGDADKEALDVAKERWSEFTEAYQKYESTLDTITSNEEAQIENHLQILANNLEAIETKIQVDLDLNKAKKTLNKFLFDISKDIRKVTKDFTKEIQFILSDFDYDLNTFNIDKGELDFIKKEIENFQKDGNYESKYFASESEAAKKYLELEEKLLDDATALQEQWQNAWDTYLESIDDVTEKWSNLMDDFDNINSSLEHQAKVVELLYGGNAQALKLNSEIYDTQLDNQRATMSAQRAQIDSLQKELNDLVAAGVTEDNEDYLKIKEALDEANKSLESSIESYLETAKKAFENATKTAMKSYESDITGGQDLSWAKEQWEMAQKSAEGYYDAVEKVYQIDSLESKWNDLLSNTSSIKAQQKIKDIMDQQLKNLENKTRLSEYDIGLAEKELEITKAEIALEEARNNKTAMTMVRNAQGNWSYQYVADQDDIAKKEQDLADALNDKYEYVKTANEKAYEDLINLESEYWSKYESIMNDTEISDEQRTARLAELENYYYNSETGILTSAYRKAEQTKQDLNKTTVETLKGYYDLDEQNYERMIKAEQELIDALKEGIIQDEEDIVREGERLNEQNLTSWQTAAKAMSDAWDADDGESVKARVSQAMDEITIAHNDYIDAVKLGCEAAGIDYTNITDAVTALRNKTEEAKNKTQELINVTDKISNTYSSVDGLRQKWEEVASSITSVIGKVEQYTKSLVEAKEKKKELNDVPDTTGNGGTDDSKPGRGGNSQEEETSNKQVVYAQYTGHQSANLVNAQGKVVVGEAFSASQNMDEKEVKSNFDLNGYNNLYTLGGVYGMNAKGDYYGIDSGSQTIKAWYKKENAQNKDSDVKTNLDINKVRVGERTAERLDDVVKFEATVGNSVYTYYTTLDEWKNKMTSTPSLSIKKWSEFDTGGYTGSWSGDSGKLAMLHQKELILNASDTENMLNIVSVVREIANLGSSISEVIANGISSLLGKSLALNSPKATYTTNDTTNNSNQVFNITAEFPNANDVETIKEAILDLPNLAKQYLR